MQLFNADTTIFKKKKLKIAPENMKKTPSKVAHNRPPIFVSVLPTGPKSAQISYSVPARLLYNDFGLTYFTYG